MGVEVTEEEGGCKVIQEVAEDVAEAMLSCRGRQVVDVDEVHCDCVVLCEVEDEREGHGKWVVELVVDKVVVNEGLADIGEGLADIAGLVCWEEELPGQIDGGPFLLEAFGVGVQPDCHDCAKPGFLY